MQTIVLASREMTITELAGDYELSETRVREALDYYKNNRAKIDSDMRAEAWAEHSRKPAG